MLLVRKRPAALAQQLNQKRRNQLLKQQSQKLLQALKNKLPKLNIKPLKLPRKRQLLTPRSRQLNRRVRHPLRWREIRRQLLKELPKLRQCLHLKDAIPKDSNPIPPTARCSIAVSITVREDTRSTSLRAQKALAGTKASRPVTTSTRFPTAAPIVHQSLNQSRAART